MPAFLIAMLGRGTCLEFILRNQVTSGPPEMLTVWVAMQIVRGPGIGTPEFLKSSCSFLG